MNTKTITPRLVEFMTYSSIDSDSDADEALDALLLSNKRLFNKTQYIGLVGVLEFGGEFYPPSRLHHLERRLGIKTLIFDKETSFFSRPLVHDEDVFRSQDAEAVELFYRCDHLTNSR